MRKILLLALFILMGSVTYAQKAEIFTDKVDKDGYRTTITKYISCAKGLIDPCPISVALFRFSKDDQTSWSLHTIWRCPNSFSIPQGGLFMIKLKNGRVIELKQVLPQERTEDRIGTYSSFYKARIYSMSGTYEIDENDIIDIMKFGVEKTRVERSLDTFDTSYKKDKIGPAIGQQYELILKTISSEKDIRSDF